MNNRTFVTLLVLVVVIAVVAIVLLWHPARTLAPVAPAQPSVATTTAFTQGDLQDATYSLYGDTFTLADGQAALQGHAWSATSTPLIPMGYTFAAFGSGDVTGTGTQGSVVAAYRSFGADLIWTTLFVFTNTNNTPQQLAAGVAYQDDAKIQSVSVANGVITLNLLVVSAADQQLPHYEQAETQPLALKFKVSGDQVVPVE